MRRLKSSQALPSADAAASERPVVFDRVDPVCPLHPDGYVFARPPNRVATCFHGDGHRHTIRIALVADVTVGERRTLHWETNLRSVDRLNRTTAPDRG